MGIENTKDLEIGSWAEAAEIAEENKQWPMEGEMKMKTYEAALKFLALSEKIGAIAKEFFGKESIGAAEIKLAGGVFIVSVPFIELDEEGNRNEGKFYTYDLCFTPYEPVMEDFMDKPGNKGLFKLLWNKQYVFHANCWGRFKKWNYPEFEEAIIRLIEKEFDTIGNE